jgi:hypothetical protein
MAEEAHGLEMQEHRAALAAAERDRACGRVEDLVELARGAHVGELRQLREAALDPVRRCRHRDADPVVLADQQQRERLAAAARIARRLEAGEGGGVVDGCIAERAAHDRVGGKRRGESESLRASVREGEPDRARKLRRNRAGLRHDPELAAAPDLVPSLCDRILARCTDREQRVEQRIAP